MILILLFFVLKLRESIPKIQTFDALKSTYDMEYLST